MKQSIPLFIVILTLNLQAQGISSTTYENDQVLRLVMSHAQRGMVWLGSGETTFLTLYREPADHESKRAAIILHSMGMHADWPDLISPLRHQLPDLGWTTLSVQLPLLDPQVGLAEYGSTFKLAKERIRSSIFYLQERGYDDIVIIAYSFGVTTAVNYLVDYNNVVKALIGISIQPHQFLKPFYGLIEELSKISVPILDIYGDQDYSEVLKSTDDRRLAAIKGGNQNYKQVIFRGANHQFTGMELDLAHEIIEWLNQVIPDAGEE